MARFLTFAISLMPTYASMSYAPAFYSTRAEARGQRLRFSLFRCRCRFIIAYILLILPPMLSLLIIGLRQYFDAD